MVHQKNNTITKFADIQVEPQGKARPRFTKKGRAYTPQQTKDYEDLIKYEFIRQCGNNPTDKPVSLSVTAYFKIPKGTSKIKSKKMASGLIKPTKKPDADNIIKAVADALNGIAYLDDKQIVECSCYKKYDFAGSVEITVIYEEERDAISI